MTLFIANRLTRGKQSYCQRLNFIVRLSLQTVVGILSYWQSNNTERTARAGAHGSDSAHTFIVSHGSWFEVYASKPEGTSSFFVLVKVYEDVPGAG